MHFTQFVWAEANRVGCAVSTNKKSGKNGIVNYIFLACDYSNGNTFGTPVYEVYEGRSACMKGKNSDYPGLCSINEEYPVSKTYATYVPSLPNYCIL